MHTLLALFGAPAAIAGQHTLTAKAHALMASWLRCAEALLRHLLLIEAAALTLAPPRARPSRARAPRADTPFNPDDPQTWRAPFSCCAAARLRHAQTGASLSLSKGGARRNARFPSALPLARRFEAVLRAFNDPAPYARRLARTLRAAPQRTTAVLHIPPEAQHRLDRFAHLLACADDAVKAFNSS